VARPQPSDGATLTHLLRRDDGRLDPGRTPAELERQVRALQPWPGTHVEASGQRLAVRRAHVDAGRPHASNGLTDGGDPSADGTPGALVAVGDELALVATGGLLVLDEVQPAGRRWMTGREYRRGRPDLTGRPAPTPGGRSPRD
jgi:methionyl-tRNA formyltransferase